MTKEEKKALKAAKKQERKARRKSFWSDFKAFVMRGNVFDLAVGVVVGGAFGKITTGFVNYIINPLLGLIIKDGDLDSIKTVITAATYDTDGVTVLTEEVAILWGTWIQTIIDFLIVAFCIFAAFRLLKKLSESAQKTAEKGLGKLKNGLNKLMKDEEDQAEEVVEQPVEEVVEEVVEEQAPVVEPEQAGNNVEDLLAEIRDLLKNKQ